MAREQQDAFICSGKRALPDPARPFSQSGLETAEKKKKNISLSHYRERNEHRQQAGEERFDLLFAKVSGLCSPHEPYGAGWAVVLLEEAGPLPLPVTPQPWDLLLLLDPITSGSGAHMASVLW